MVLINDFLNAAGKHSYLWNKLGTFYKMWHMVI